MASRTFGLVPLAGWTLVAGALALGGGGVSVTRADPAATESAQEPVPAAASCQAPAPLEPVRLDPKRFARSQRGGDEFVSLNTRGYNYVRGSGETAPQVSPEQHVPHHKAEQPGSK